MHRGFPLGSLLATRHETLISPLVLLIIKGADPEVDACPPVPMDTSVPPSLALLSQTSTSDVIYHFR